MRCEGEEGGFGGGEGGERLERAFRGRGKIGGGGRTTATGIGGRIAR
jgi:hypothetical protein